MPVEEAGVDQRVESRECGGGVAGQLSGLAGEPPSGGDVAAPDEACGGGGEEDGAVRMVGGDPIEELLGPQQWLVEEAGLRVHVEVG